MVDTFTYALTSPTVFAGSHFIVAFRGAEIFENVVSSSAKTGLEVETVIRVIGRTSTCFLLLLASAHAFSSDRDDLSKPAIIVSHSPEVKDHKFTFEVRLYPNPSDKRKATLSVICSRGLKCAPLQQSVSLAAPNIQPFIAEEIEELNSAEIDISLAIDGGKVLGDAQVLDFGLIKSIARIGSDAPKEFKAGEARPVHFWLEDSAGARVKPTSTVFIEISKSTDCAGLKAVPTDVDPKTRQFGDGASTNIPEWRNEALDAIWIAPYHWNQGSCQLDLLLTSAGQPIFRSTLVVPTSPDYGTALIACLLGGVVQYLLASLVQIVLLARSKSQVNFYQIFVGPNGVEIIETLLKALLAYLLAYILNTTELVQFKGAGNNSLLGFGTFAFLLGFWQLKPLWDAIRNLSKMDHKSAGQIDSVAEPQAEVK